MVFDEKLCPICTRAIEPDAKFCKYHKKAYESIRENYEYWRKAYDELSWEKYLEKLIENPENGVWVKEVAKNLITKKSEE